MQLWAPHTKDRQSGNLRATGSGTEWVGHHRRCRNADAAAEKLRKYRMSLDPRPFLMHVWYLDGIMVMKLSLRLVT